MTAFTAYAYTGTVPGSEAQQQPVIRDPHPWYASEWTDEQAPESGPAVPTSGQLWPRGTP